MDNGLLVLGNRGVGREPLTTLTFPEYFAGFCGQFSGLSIVQITVRSYEQSPLVPFYNEAKVLSHQSVCSCFMAVISNKHSNVFTSSSPDKRGLILIAQSAYSWAVVKSPNA